MFRTKCTDNHGSCIVNYRSFYVLRTDGWIVGLGTGTAVGLTGGKLMIAVIVNFFRGITGRKHWHVCAEHGIGLHSWDVSQDRFSYYDGFCGFHTAPCLYKNSSKYFHV